MAPMPKIKRSEHQFDPGKEEDVIIKASRFRIYFQNRYMLISLTNDILTGLFYIFGSIVSLTSLPAIYGTIAYLIGGVFLTIRPLIKIVRHVYIYNERNQEGEKEKMSPSPTMNVDGATTREEFPMLKTFDGIALTLLIIGGINWLLVGAFEFDLVAAITGGSTSIIARVIYILVGISALYSLKFFPAIARQQTLD